MDLNQTPGAQRIHIGLFGCTNSGKSSLINALTGQPAAIVSEVKGTTTDPVSKAMELLPLGPVVFIDTPGLDDFSRLGALRIERAKQTLNKTDLALLVVDATTGMGPEDRDVLDLILDKKIPCAVVLNKMDLLSEDEQHTLLSSPGFRELGQIPTPDEPIAVFMVSALSGMGIFDLKEGLPGLLKDLGSGPRLISDLVTPSDLVVLVVPIDSSAPKGRLILPQQQTIRDLLDAGVPSVVTGVENLAETLDKLKDPPSLVVTDSQVFESVSKIVPACVPLTSFSILFARYRGDLQILVEGAAMIDRLQSKDRILISEGCTHHRQCEDIGTVKLPKWLASYTGKMLEFDFTSGIDFPSDLSRYRLIIHCGACTLNQKEMQHRLKCARAAGIPITNYGIAIAMMKGILARSLSPLQGK